ncbi:MAG: hypothetical protein M3Q58_01830 [Bacteroidota bacterium]|nr:hypothetical protein [Bacteroidota bacterium]
MKFISERVSVSETKESLSIVIAPDVEPLKQTLLFTWVVFWSVAGLIILTQIFEEYNREQKTFMFIWLLFWAYFEYISVYALLWKKYGYEKIAVKDGKFFYKRNIKGRGKTQIFAKPSKENINIEKDNESSILSSLNKSYWIVGAEKILINSNSNKVKLGIKLNNNEAASVLKLIKRHL